MNIWCHLKIRNCRSRQWVKLSTKIWISWPDMLEVYSKVRIFRLNIRLLHIKQFLNLLYYLLYMLWGIQFCRWHKHWGFTWHLFIQCDLCMYVYMYACSYVFERKREWRKERKRKKGGKEERRTIMFQPVN